MSREKDGLQVDLVTHDLKKFFSLFLKRNGAVLEQLLSPLIVLTTPAHEELKSLAGRLITRQHHHHYLNFAETQWTLFQMERPHRLKPLLYSYRVLLTGIRLMRTGQVEASLPKLNEKFQLPFLHDLIARKTEGAEGVALDERDVDFHRNEYARLSRSLEEAAGDSDLPEVPQARAELHDLLVRLRLSTLDPK
jgi:predicted nucleotidyltransferase